jgi:elongation factor P
MIQVNDLKPGMNFAYENNIFVVLDTLHNKTAMRQMIVKVKVKNLRSGTINEVSFTGGDKVDSIHIEKQPMEYLYDDGRDLVFMNTESYEQIGIPKDRLQWELKFLAPNQSVEVTVLDGEILGVALPAKVRLKVAHTDPAVAGNTATRALKDAELETGLSVRVPLFINEEDYLWIRTDNGDYDSRA